VEIDELGMDCSWGSCSFFHYAAKILLTLKSNQMMAMGPRIRLALKWVHEACEVTVMLIGGFFRSSYPPPLGANHRIYVAVSWCVWILKTAVF
jgi:hypothetical protein